MNEQQVFEAVFKATGVGDFEKAIAGAQDSVKSFENASKKIRDTGATLTKAITLPILGIGIASGKVAADFETAMTGVAKTTDLTAQEFSDMEDAILEMTRVIPASATEIAGVAEAAGQLGIEKENILGFTETMVNLGVATNISAEEAATSLARLANITGMPQTEFDKLGSVIVELGNNLATTEGEIVDMGLRLAGTASQVGLTEAEIMALAGAMSSVGISAEAGGTAMSTVMQKINTSVLSGSEEMAGFAKVAGMSAEDFATAWEDSPQTAITAFIEGLGGMNAEGVDTVTMLKDLGISGIREVDTLNRLSGASGLLAESFGMASGAWEENTALSEEAQTAYETTANKIQLAKNAIIEAGIALGDHLLPYVQKVAEFVADLAQRFSNLNPAIQVTTIVIGAIVAAIGPLLMLVGQMGLGISALGTFFVGAAGSTSMFATVIAALTSPVTLVIAAIAALAGVMVYLYNTNETVREAINTAWQGIKDVIMQAVAVISEYVRSVIGGLVAWWQENNQMILAAAQNVWGAIQTVIIAAMGIISSIMQTVWPMIMAVVKFAWDGIKNVIDGAIKVITGIIQAFSALFTGNWSALWAAIKQIVSGAVQALWGLVQLWLVGKIIGAVKAFAGMMKSLFSSAWAYIKNIFSSSLSWIGGKVSSGLGAIKGTFTTIFNSLKGIVSNAFSAVKGAVKGGMNTAWNVIKGFFGKFKSAGKNIIGNLVSGITSKVDNVKNAVGNVLSAARNLLPFSPPKDKSSPMVGLEKNGIVDNIAQGIMSNEGEIQSAMNQALDVDTPMVNGRVSHEMNNNLSTQPAYINVNIGGQNFRGFVENISNEQGKITDLELQF